MIYLINELTTTVDLFARGGGGGSSSGGGDGGGGIIALIGYLPMHLIGSLLRKYTINRPFWVIAQIIGWIVCVLFFGALLFLGVIGFFIGIGAVVGMGAGLYNWFAKLKRNKKTTEQLQKSAQLDPAWNEQAILDRTKQLFIQYQADWSRRDWQAMKAYTTPSYYMHAALMVAVLNQLKRIDTVQNPTVQEVMIVDARDSDLDHEDTVTVGITARADDSLIEEETGKVLFEDRSSFTEFWKLRRQGDTWVLDGIEQATKLSAMEDRSLAVFAKENGYFFSPDMGWLFIPKRGSLFSSAKFGTSDINNHVVGVYNNNYLLQLYTYLPAAAGSGTFLIAQTNVPKNYGNIVVRRKKWFNMVGPDHLSKISMEWGDFNKKYEVYASRREEVTSFELLHPAFMEKLEALPFEVNIEVVDNVVYLYSPRKGTKHATADYNTMLQILQEAYKQMKM